MANQKEVFLTKFSEWRPGGGRPSKWLDLEAFLVQKIKEAWERGMPISSEQLLIMFQAYIQQFDFEEAKSVFVYGKKNTVTTFIRRFLIGINTAFEKTLFPRVSRWTGKVKQRIMQQGSGHYSRKKRLTSSSTPMKPLFYFICKVTMSSYQKE